MPQRSFERLKNFSSQVSVHQTVSQIEKMLAAHGATETTKEYVDGEPSALIFVVETPQGERHIKLPVNVDKVMDVFSRHVEDGKLPKKYSGSKWAKEQAARTAWRNIKDWIDAQLALLSVEMVQMIEIFLPYVYDLDGKMTLFEAFEEQGYNTKLLTQGDL